MSQNRIDLILPTLGALDYVRQCLDTLPLGMQGIEYRLIIYDNDISMTDGTRDFLIEYAEDRDNVHLVLSERTISHGHALDEAAKLVTTPFFGAIHSDVEFLMPCFAFMYESIARQPDAVYVGILRSGGIRQLEGRECAWMVMLPQVRQVISLYRTEFIRKHNLSFQHMLSTVRVTDKDKGDSAYPPEHVFGEGELLQGGQVELRGDTGWQLFACARRLGKQLLPLPDFMGGSFKHHRAKSRDFMKKLILGSRRKEWRNGERERGERGQGKRADTVEGACPLRDAVWEQGQDNRGPPE